MNKETIQALKERAKEMLNDDYSRKIGPEEIYTIICEWENTVSELETYKKIVDEKNKELNEENLRCSFYAIENNDLKEKLEIQGNITETYKKIAEKLAEVVDLGYMPFECSPMCIHDNCIKECTLDWARKEVEKDE